MHRPLFPLLFPSLLVMFVSLVKPALPSLYTHNLEDEEEDRRTEFVRTTWSDDEYQRKFTPLRTYSAPALKAMECYSCMSLSYQINWKYLAATYHLPKIFTDRCRDPQLEARMPTIHCSTLCVSLLEPDIEAGVFIGYKHIRGCLDRVLRHGFNQTALKTHRFHHNNQCRTLSRSQLFNPAKINEHPAIGDVQLCACYGDRCNLGLFSSCLTSCLLVILGSFLLLLRESSTITLC